MGNVKGNFQKMVLVYKSQRFINHYLSLQAEAAREKPPRFLR